MFKGRIQGRLWDLRRSSVCRFFGSGIVVIRVSCIRQVKVSKSSAITVSSHMCKFIHADLPVGALCSVQPSGSGNVGAALL